MTFFKHCKLLSAGMSVLVEDFQSNAAPQDGKERAFERAKLLINDDSCAPMQIDDEAEDQRILDID